MFGAQQGQDDDRSGPRCGRLPGDRLPVGGGLGRPGPEGEGPASQPWASTPTGSAQAARGRTRRRPSTLSRTRKRLAMAIQRSGWCIRSKPGAHATGGRTAAASGRPAGPGRGPGRRPRRSRRTRPTADPGRGSDRPQRARDQDDRPPPPETIGLAPPDAQGVVEDRRGELRRQGWGRHPLPLEHHRDDLPQQGRGEDRAEGACRGEVAQLRPQGTTLTPAVGEEGGDAQGQHGGVEPVAVAQQGHAPARQQGRTPTAGLGDAPEPEHREGQPTRATWEPQRAQLRQEHRGHRPGGPAGQRQVVAPPQGAPQGTKASRFKGTQSSAAAESHAGKGAARGSGRRPASRGCCPR